MATPVTVHAHAAPQGFIRKYIFSLDHKVIGIQYFFLALTAVWVGMFLSLLMRIHLIWPNAVLPLVGEIKPETYLSLLTMHGTIMVFFVLTTAPQGGFGNYFLPIQIGAPDMAFPVLNMLSFWTTFVAFVTIMAAFFVTGGAPLHGWTGYAPLSALPSAGPGEQLGADLWITSIAIFCIASLMGALNFITTTLDLRAKGMTMMRMPLTVWSWFITAILGTAGVWRVALGGNSAADGSESGYEFLCAAGGGERTDHGAQGRIATAVAASVLVLRASGGVHRDPAGDGRGVAGSVDVLAQADLWI
jgi:heme/copper-type cytochrome/quinol oxidase subunit 1